MAYSRELWIKAKKLCRLNDNDILMAQRLSLNPKSLIKNIPNKSEPWKEPVKVWIRRMYEDKYGELPAEIHKNKNHNHKIQVKNEIDELPFK